MRGESQLIATTKTSGTCLGSSEAPCGSQPDSFDRARSASFLAGVDEDSFSAGAGKLSGAETSCILLGMRQRSNSAMADDVPALLVTKSSTALKTNEGEASFLFAKAKADADTLSAAELAYWPLQREKLHRTTLDILSLHNLPKVQHHPRSNPRQHDHGHACKMRFRAWNRMESDAQVLWGFLCQVAARLLFTARRKPAEIQRLLQQLPQVPPRAQRKSSPAQQSAAEPPGDRSGALPHWR